MSAQPSCAILSDPKPLTPRKLVGAPSDRLVNKALDFAMGTSCGIPVNTKNGPERLHAVSAGLCRSWLCSQQCHIH